MWDFCDNDSVPDNDTSGDKLIQSEKIAMTYRNFVVRCFLYVMANGAVTQQPPAGYNNTFYL